MPVVLMLMVCTHTVLAQRPQNEASIQTLSLTFKVEANNYGGKPQSRCSLLFAVADKWKLPANGWKIYFSFARQILATSVTGGLQIRHINGDFFCISPTADFKGIEAGKSLSTGFTSSEWLINKTDSPDGFYLIWDNAPGKTYRIDKVKMLPFETAAQYMRSPLDKIGVSTAESVFAENQNIRDIPGDSLVKVFPTPVAYKELPGSFVLDGGVRVKSDPEFKSEQGYLNQTLNSLLLPAKGKTDRVILLQQKPMADEAYELTVGDRQITISASSGAGIFYGIQSLKTMMAPGAYRRKQKNITIKHVEVSDVPRFGYRALMLDVARNFQPKKEILKLLDVMSLYKLNVLHFHLTDDEGWRLEIPGLPELTTIGAKRSHTLSETDRLQPGLGSGPDVGNAAGSGYYSKADFVEILKYATARHIKIIPEIESPGHARAAIKAMDARYKNFAKLGQMVAAEQYLLHDWKDTSRYTSVQYYNDNVVDVSLPSTYRFVNKVTDALVQMYREAGAPLQTIHYGGDEVPVGAWQASPAFNSLMQRDTGIHTTDDLWLYYYRQINKILNIYHLYLTAWEETGLVKQVINNQKANVVNKGLLGRDVRLEVWNNVLGWGAEDLAYKQANAGYKVILSCVSNLYFDMAYDKAFDEPGYYWGGYAGLDKVFKFIPYNYFKNTTEDRMGIPLNKAYLQSKEQLTETGKANIVGLQGALWGETLKSPQRMEYMLLPKLLGLAERAWSADPEWAAEADSTKAKALYDEDWSRFVNTLGKRELPRLDHYVGGFVYRIPKAGAIWINNTLVANSQLPGFTLRYTLDGSLPNVHSTPYKKPVPNCTGCIIKIAVFSNNNQSATVMPAGNKTVQ